MTGSGHLAFDLTFARGGQRFHFAAATGAPILGCFGPSGSGKTSLLLALAGLLRCEASRIGLPGGVVVDSAAGRVPPPHRRRIALCFQEPRLLPHRSVAANLRYGERLVPPPARRVGFEPVVDLLDLGGLLERRPAALSGGERQRVALGRALLCSPRLLACDEAFVGLDRGRKRELLRYLRRVPEVLRAPLLVVGHDLGDLLQLTDHLALVEDRRIIACDHLGVLVRDPALLPRLHDLGLLWALRGEIAEAASGRARLRLDGRELRISPGDLRPGDRVTVALRPDDVGLATAPVSGTSFRNQIPVSVSFITATAERCLVGLRMGEADLLAQVSPQTIAELDLQVGRRCVALIKAEALRVL